MATRNGITKTKEGIEAEIKSCIRSLHEDFNDEAKASFWRGRISSLEWVLGQ
jgi:hypothetical protein